MIVVGESNALVYVIRGILRRSKMPNRFQFLLAWPTYVNIHDARELCITAIESSFVDMIEVSGLIIIGGGYDLF